MKKPWTTREQKDCASAYSTQGLGAAIAVTGRTREAIYRMMGKMGVRSAHIRSSNIKKKDRQWYAEDAAMMMELSYSGITSNLIAEYFNTSASAIRNVMSLAKAEGFDAYPLRNK
jgi:hypothetical protein